MKYWLWSAVACAALGIGVLAAQTQNRPAQTPPPAPAGQSAPSADPYLRNAAAGTTDFPLAAKAGQDSHARTSAPPGALNQGPFDPGTWKYGSAFDPPAGAKVWNPVKLKLMEGGKVTGGTLFSA